MSNFIDISNVATANVNDKVEIANQVRVKSSNGMWARPLAEQAALITLENNIVGGAVETNSFKDVEDKLNGLSNYVKPVNEPISYITGLQTALDTKATTTALNTEKARIDAILSGAGANADTFAEIVTLINSVDTTNDTAFSGYVTSNNARSTTIETNVTNLTNNKANKATTLAGYGITNVYTKTETDTAINTALSIIDCGSIA